MSTRCQIGFYASATQALAAPDVLLYKHLDGYPDTPNGVLATLLPWATDFATHRGLSDTEYAAARALVALIRGAEDLNGYLSYGICGDRELHGDTQYFYRVDPEAITVYTHAFGPHDYDTLREMQTYPVGAAEHDSPAIVLKPYSILVGFIGEPLWREGEAQTCYYFVDATGPCAAILAAKDLACQDAALAPAHPDYDTFYACLMPLLVLEGHQPQLCLAEGSPWE
jgi:hypothetical protein